MTVREWLKENGKDLSEVRVMSSEWNIEVTDYRKPDCGCLNETVMDVTDNMVWVA